MVVKVVLDQEVERFRLMDILLIKSLVDTLKGVNDVPRIHMAFYYPISKSFQSSQIFQMLYISR